MKEKLKIIFKDDFDHVSVTNPDGNGQQVVIYVISDQFKGLMTVARHRKINEILKEEIKTVHAVSIDTKTLE